MTLGFLMASRLPVIASVSIVVASEVMLAIMIRDNLVLNILMLIWPVEAIKNWQLG
jgi:predicted exporter